MFCMYPPPQMHARIQSEPACVSCILLLICMHAFKISPHVLCLALMCCGSTMRSMHESSLCPPYCPTHSTNPPLLPALAPGSTTCGCRTHERPYRHQLSHQRNPQLPPHHHPRRLPPYDRICENDATMLNKVTRKFESSIRANLQKHATTLTLAIPYTSTPPIQVSPLTLATQNTN
jgi:hypothetical protein